MISSALRNRLLLLSALTLCLIAPAPLLGMRLGAQTLVAHDLPSPHMPNSTPKTADFDGDGSLEQLRLVGSSARIRGRQGTLWTSPESWHVVQAQITDLNHDDIPEATLLLWRPFAAWPIDAYIPHPGRIDAFHNRQGRSCHVIMIGWQQDSFGELWAGSALVDPLLDFTAIDMNGDGQQALAGLEGRYDSWSHAAQAVSLWAWNGFGFTLVARSPVGHYTQLMRVSAPDGQEMLLVQGFQRR